MNLKKANYILYKYIIIREKWYEKETNNTGEVGLKLEKLLGGTGGDFNIPDYKGFEIKCIKKYTSYKKLNLFTAAPYGKTIFPIQEIANKYGWKDKDYKNIKRISCEISAIENKKIGVYNATLKIDEEENRIYLIIKKGNEIKSDSTYWEINELKVKLERKMTNLALIEYYKKIENNKEFFKYGNISFYELKKETFIKLIKEGKIYIRINYGVKKSGLYQGKHIDHGSTFVINYENVNLLYRKIK